MGLARLRQMVVQKLKLHEGNCSTSYCWWVPIFLARRAYDGVVLDFFAEADPLLIVMILLAGFAAGWIDAVVGGGGLIQLPALLLLPGITPLQALATNKIGSIMGTAVSSVTYALKIRPRWSFVLPAAALAFCASYLGSAFASTIPSEAFVPLVMIALAVVLIVVLVKPNLGTVAKETASRTAGKALAIGMAFGTVVGFYDGLIGPGTGTFLVMGFVMIAGMSFLQSSGSAKIINFSTNLGSLFYFFPAGFVHLEIGLMLGAANILGSFLGARMALKRGSGFIKFVLVAVTCALLLRLGAQQLGY